MEDEKQTFAKTMKSKAALDTAANVKKFYELINSGMDPTTAFPQVFMGVYYLVPPEPPRPDYLMTLSELHSALKAAHSRYSLIIEQNLVLFAGI